MPPDTPSRIPPILSVARRIWPESCHWDLHNCYALFRKEFHLKERPGRAPLFISADQSYQLYLNGRYVCRGLARRRQESRPDDEVAVRPWLKKGSNLVAVRARLPGRDNFQSNSRAARSGPCSTHALEVNAA